MSCTFKSALIALISAAALTPAVFAETSAEPASIRVAYGDLNMSSAAGGRTLLKRISIAARKACQKVTETSLLKPLAVSSCKHETIASTVRRLNMVTLTAAWEGAPASTVIASR
jgi:UrcA family protein